MKDSEALTRVIQLLDQLSGPEQGRSTLNRLAQSDDSIASIARDIAGSPAFERLYRDKEARTMAREFEGRKEAEAAFVEMPNLDFGLTFEEQFDRSFFPRLGARAEGFATIFRSLPSPPEKLLIVETGCLRMPGNWEGDGQSTFMFDTLVRVRGGFFFSIDVNVKNIATARRACSSSTNLILGDSVATLHNLGALIARPANLLYLDSFDLDLQNPMPSAIHHAMELIAAQPLIGPGTIICVDDYKVADESPAGGKGLLLDLYFSRIRAEVLYSGYQKVWRLA
jgi:hypothetical protein